MNLVCRDYLVNTVLQGTDSANGRREVQIREDKHGNAIGLREVNVKNTSEVMR